jgi:ParB-like chromosome segregation protein Spo0J
MSILDTKIVAHADIVPNDWNPNKQTDRAFEAEIESILDNGFIVPVTVREHPDKKGKYQIVDGFHRWKAIGEIIAKGLKGNGNITEIISTKNVPVVVIEADDATAKRLTVILNETRGHADMGELAILLGSLQDELGDELIRGLPYSDRQLAELLSLSEFDWSALEIPETESEEEDDETSAKIVAVLTPAAEILWTKALIQHAAELPKGEKQAAGKLIEILLNK